MVTSAAESQRARIGLVSDHLFPFSYGGAERVYRVLSEALVSDGAELTYFTRQQWASGAHLETPFEVINVWKGDVYDANGTRHIGAALRWSSALLQTLWRSDLDVLIVSATPVFNVFAGLFVKVRRPRMVLVVDWLEIWPWKKWHEYSGGIVGTFAWLLQSAAVHIGAVRLVNGFTTLSRLPKRAQGTAITLPLVAMAGPPQTVEVATSSYELLFVGRHIPDKNLPTLPPVIAALQAEFPKIRATVIGDGPDRSVAELAAVELGVSDRISFVGRVNDEELGRYLQTAGALFFPSVREGFGLVVCEAARFGTPSVVVKHPDNAAVNLVKTGVNGAIAESIEVRELCNAIRACFKGGDELRRTTKNWYDDAWSQSGGFAGVARSISALARGTKR